MKHFKLLLYFIALLFPTKIFSVYTSTVNGQTFYYQYIDSKLTLIAPPDGSKYKGDVDLSPCYVGSRQISTIGDSAFFNCTELTSVTAPYVYTVGNRSFENCTNLTTVNMPHANHFGGWAFYNCENLENLTINTSALVVQNFAFANTGLEEFTVRGGSTFLGGCFASCPYIHFKLYNDDAGYYFQIVDDVLYENGGSGATLICYPASKTSTTTNPFTFPAKITFSNSGNKDVTYSIGIQKYAFEGAKGLYTITIPPYVNYVGMAAFRNCSNLTTVDWQVSADSIRSWTFGNCSKLENMTIPNVKKIGNRAFYNTGFKTITIPSDVSTIGENAFGKCSNLSQILVDENNTDYKSYDGVLFDAQEDTLITYPAGKTGAYSVPFAVSAIGDYAFNGASGLTSLTLSSNLKKIGNYSFAGCTALKSIVDQASTPQTVSATSFANEDCSTTLYSQAALSVPNNNKSTYTSTDYWKNFSSISSIPIPVTGITIYGTSTIWVGETAILSTTVTPSDATNKNVTWKSSNTSVATVSSSGKVTGVSKGTATITATAADGSGVYKTYTITVKQPVTSISLSASSATLWIGKTQTLTATATPTTANNTTVTWASSNPSVATVSSSGVVTAYAKGTATITCTASDGYGTQATCTVTVKQPVTSISLSATSSTLWVGNTQTLTATATPTTANNTAVTWSSSNTSVATVSSSGVITAKAKGTATITCTASDGYGTKATCAVTVKQPVTSISLSSTSATLWVGKTQTLTTSATPTTANSTAVTWSSSNTSVATVSSSGVITAVAKGTATITCTASDGYGTKATCSVTVKQPVTSISLSATTATLWVGKTQTLTATATPTTANSTAVTWSNSNTSVATVSSSGVITAVAKGTATITCTASDGYGTKATCSVTVKQPVTSVSLSSSSLTLVAGETSTITATATPTTANNTSVNWSSSNSSVATVSGGTITAISTGTATITATAADGYGSKSTCTVTVIARGDVTGDATIDNDDINAVVKFMMGDTDTDGLYFDAADWNNNGKVTSTDVIATVRLALNGKTDYVAGSKGKRASSASKLFALDDINLKAGETTEVSVRLTDSMDKFSSMLFDVTLPEGVTIENATQGSRTANHSVVYARHDDGTVRVICYSMSNESFAEGSGDVVKLTLKADNNVADGAYNLSFQNIKLSRRDITSVVSESEDANLVIGNATGIANYQLGNSKMTASYANGSLSITAGEDGAAAIYSANGALIYKKNLKSGDKVSVSLPRGVYVINGVKTAVK